MKGHTTVIVEQIEAAIASASPSAFEALNRAIWAGLSSGALSEQDAERLSVAIHDRQTVAKATSGPVGGPRTVASVYPPRRPQRPPVRAVAIERRRRLAASGPLPPALAARFTVAELATLRIVGDEIREKGRCALPIDCIAARAGVGRTSAQNALRLARRLGLVRIEERRRTGAKSLPNIVTVIDREWSAWLARGPKATGLKTLSTTDKESLSGERKVASSGSILPTRPRFSQWPTTRQRR